MAGFAAEREHTLTIDDFSYVYLDSGRNDIKFTNKSLYVHTSNTKSYNRSI
jgi:hypothetical protein